MNADQSEADKLSEAVRSAPPGTYRVYRGTGTGAEANILQHLANLEEVRARVETAIRSDCLIEVIALRLQVMDYWLRIFFVNRMAPGQRREREFGRLVTQCGGLGLDRDLQRRLSAFNRHRVHATHGYIVGTIKYEVLRPVVRESKLLRTDVIINVLENCGEAVTSLDGRTFEVGDMILNVPYQVQQLRVGRDL